MKKVKREISWFLIISIILAFSVNVYADASPEVLSKKDVLSINSIEDAFGEYRTDRIIFKDNTTVYHIPNTGISSYVSTYHDNYGNVLRVVREENIVDFILFSSDGFMYINGGKVVVTNDAKASDSVNLRYRTVDYSTTPWYGPDSNYSVYIGSVQKASVNTGDNLLAELTTIAICELIAYVLGVPSGYVSIFIAIASSIKTSAELYAPDSAYLSYSGSKFEHSTASSPIDRYYKYSINYYARANYQTYVGNSVYYENNYFN